MRKTVIAQGGPNDWALPYWDYSAGAPSNAIPLPFRSAQLPDGSPNPLLVPARRTGINTGTALPAAVTSTTTAMNSPAFTTPLAGAPVGFGGPRTGFAHFGPAPGALENQPHNIVHVAVGGPGGLMSDPDTAALDPIFWLHHANIDRLWETWHLNGHTNDTTTKWKRRTFKLRDDTGTAVTMRVDGVLDITAQLDYTYDVLPAVAASTPPGAPAMPSKKVATVGKTAAAVHVPRDGATATVPVGELPGLGAAASGRRRQFHLDLADIEGPANPGVVYGVYVNLPANPNDADLQAHLAGVVAFFGIEHSTTARKTGAAQPLRYSFDVTDLVERLHAAGDAAELRVALLPIAGTEDSSAAAAADDTSVKVGTISLLSS